MPATVYPLATALAWAIAVILFKRSGEQFGPVALNVFKTVVSFLLLVATLPLTSAQWPDATRADWTVLILSGMLGIGVADTLFFVSLNILGATRQAIVDLSYSPCIVLFSFLILGERLSTLDLVGGALIVGAMGVVVARRSNGSALQGRLVLGVTCGIAAMVAMGLAIVWIKPVLERYDVMFVTIVRLIGGMAVLALIVMVRPSSRRDTRKIFVPQRAWRFALPGAIMGNYVALLLWIAGFKYNDASVASILNQTNTLFVVALAAIFLHEHLTPRRVVALALGLAGSILVLL